MARLPAHRIASGPGTSPAQARNQFGGGDHIDWSTLPVPVLSLLGFHFDPATGARYVRANTVQGRNIAITHPLDLVRVNQGAAGGWVGNFPPNEALLFTNDRPPPIEDPLKESIVIHFQNPVRGVGVQLQGMTARPSATAKFKANMVLWDLARQNWAQPDHALGSSADPEAVFLGASVDTAMVSTVQIYVDALNGQQIDFAVGRVFLKD